MGRIRPVHLINSLHSLPLELDGRRLEGGRRSVGRLILIVGMVGLALLLASILFAQTGPVLEVGTFSMAPEGDALPPGWKPLTFKKIPRHTTYTLVRDGETVAVKAVSDAASSGLTREIRINPKDYPIVRWRWKVANILQKGDVSRKDGDDYPARLYITFEYNPQNVGFFEKAKYEAINMFYGQYPPIGAINYIWESKVPKGTMLPNAYTDKAIMFVVESGREKLNTWVSEEQNVYEDYKKAFGEEPPMISGVAIMTDTDNTGESSTSYYGDIIFKNASK